MSKRFERVAVLMGGPSEEREVSLASGAAIADALDHAGYQVARIDVTSRELVLPSDVEAVFIALHGSYGEDGTVQAILEERGIPFTGSGSMASRIAFDKLASKKRFEEHGLPTPPWEELDAMTPRKLPLPVVVKPPRQGSSIGISIARDESAWTAAVADAARYDRTWLVEAFIPGRELTVGIVGDQILPIVEIRAPEGNYSFQAKYTKGMTEYLAPAPLPEPLAARCQETALAAYRALGARGLGRVDIRLAEDGTPYLLELNSIPGFTPTSLLPKAAAAAGIPFGALCERILNLATCELEPVD
ncbi:MAG TPA: D-alanine--D-alanine ligase [Kiritimatiellia bacterium]|nr:D-alanine--D-alanine ligase [Kiritimatiellia bacterium]